MYSFQKLKCHIFYFNLRYLLSFLSTSLISKKQNTMYFLNIAWSGAAEKKGEMQCILGYCASTSIAMEEE